MFEPVSPLPLAVLRIVFGAYGFVYFLRLVEPLTFAYGDQGLVRFGADLPRQIQWQFNLLRWLPLPSDLAVDVFVAAGCLVAALVMVGLWVRVAGVVLWLLSLSAVGSIHSNSGDAIVVVLAYLLMLAGLAGHSGACLSLDARRRVRWRGPAARSNQIPAWPMRLLQLQLIAIYFFTGVYKAMNAVWNQGEAMHYVFAQSSWSRMDLTWLASYPAALAALTFGVLLFELLVFPVFVWFRRSRLAVLALGLVFHYGIAMTMKVFIFQEIMTVYYICFLEERHLMPIVDRLIRRFQPGARRRVAQNAAVD